ncbi:MAG TPA: prenyltransferase/squalene oxidase repeat-containing protein [Lacipirellulaceae bacterium]|nr:prenyltransferase/squalene oxidase repeat-containing protein [Lacipirellulaceae bacterium]
MHSFHRALLALSMIATTPGALFSQTAPTGGAPAGRSKAQDSPPNRAELVQRGLAYYKTAQAPDGSFSAAAGPGVTAIAAAAMLQCGQPPDDPVVARALQYVQQHIRPDGGVYAEGSTHKNYETCIAIFAFAAANSDGRYNEAIKKAEAFLRLEQWDEGEGLAQGDLAFGGSGYGSHSRPDLSNTAFLIEALRTAGTSPEDPAIQRALAFVSRCQNLETAANTTQFAGKNPDGGFYYTIAAGGSSPAGNTEEGGLRSYGSMTYAGLKSMIYAGVDKQDDRVKAARQWIGENYTLAENPGMGTAGLYYYYHTFAKTLDALGDQTLTDAAGQKHDWRRDLVEALAASQQPDGSWINSNQRWLEADPNLVTGYSLLALSYCD